MCQVSPWNTYFEMWTIPSKITWVSLYLVSTLIRRGVKMTIIILCRVTHQNLSFLSLQIKIVLCEKLCCLWIIFWSHFHLTLLIHSVTCNQFNFSRIMRKVERTTFLTMHTNKSYTFAFTTPLWALVEITAWQNTTFYLHQYIRRFTEKVSCSILFISTY